MSALQSIFDLEPLEFGGVENRKGIDFQDHVAASFCLAMLTDTRIESVWCERQDDVTVIRFENGQRTVEFIQVKGNSFDHLWSTAEICKRKENKAGTSILEHSLAYDRCEEPHSFRLVTARPANSKLKVLTFPIGSQDRAKTPGLAEIKIEALAKLGGFKSLLGNGPSYWLDNVVFDARHSAEALANQNTISLIQHLDAISVKLAIDQTRAVYDRILSLVNKAGLASSASGGSAKKISRSLIAEKIQEYASESARPSAGGPGSTMLRKMQDAGLAQTSIASANEARYRYRSTVLQSSYMAPFDRSEAEACASAELQHLVAQMDAGRIEGGLAFHLKCLDELKELSATGKGSFDFLQGYMYSLTDRCLHRFGSAIA